MKKSTTNPKDIQKGRIARSNFMKISQSDQNFISKENHRSVLKEMKTTNIDKKKLKVHDRELGDEDIRNPFNLPSHLRLFQNQSIIRKFKPDPYIMGDTHTICDIDHTFYKVIEGRPLRQFTDVKVYMKNIRDITLLKANAAYLKDQIIQIETSFSDEIKEYIKIEKLFVKTKVNFARFAENSYDNAKLSQAKAEETSIKLANKIEQLESYSFEYVKLRNQLSNITTNFETLTVYRKFLNSLSPYEWRKKFDSYIDCSKLFPISNEEEELSSSSNVSVDIYKSSISKLQQIEPRLYFKNPEELINIYNDLSKQSLNYMEIEVFSNDILCSVLKSKDYLKANIMYEINELEGFLDIYKANVKWMEEREIECKVVFEKLVMDKVEGLYASYDVAKLFTCVQYVNTRLFGSPEDPKDSISFMLVQIESLYLKLTSGLDCLNQDVVKEATTELFTEDINMMKRAYFAQRTIRECDILSKALYTSFEPSRSKRK